MLILTRRISESLILNDNVKITVLGIKGHQVRLGIDAPRQIPIYRDEIYEKMLIKKIEDKIDQEMESEINN